MVLCELTENSSFLVQWSVLVGLALISVLGLSCSVFRLLYINPTYEIWKWKSSPNYPSSEKVRDEVFQTLKGVTIAALPPAMTIWLQVNGMSKGFCGMKYPMWQQLVSIFVFWLITDFLEWGYHTCTHVFKPMWSMHKYHHTFYNPSPFAVIADEYVDQFARAANMVFLPLLFPVNIDMMFIHMGVISYAYGVYMHSGYEFSWPNAHTPIINSSYQHYAHHALSVYNKPYWCGFFMKIFDVMAGTEYQGVCLCANCCQKRGERTPEKFKEIVIPDYAELGRVSFWMEPILKNLGAGPIKFEDEKSS
eukprot:Platyproteum_vivax@DN21_c0_g1_i1.p2